jgi:putative FmdB family regulatory protein
MSFPRREGTAVYSGVLREGIPRSRWPGRRLDFLRMPTYEYVCKQCGHRVEAVQSISDPPLRTCGVCGGELRKVFHPAGLLFKGSGFYSTDSRAKPKEEAAKKDAPSKGDANKEGAGKKKEGSGSDVSTKEGTSSDSTDSSGSSGSPGDSSKGSGSSSTTEKSA